MKKKVVLILTLFFILFINLTFISAIRINEIELNPSGTDTGNEWIELYSQEEINLSGWKLVNNDKNVFVLNSKFQGYLTIIFTGQWLDNSNEKIILENINETVADETILLTDSYNDNRTWQYCNGNWSFTSSTKNSDNDCEGGQEENNENNETNENKESSTKSIYLELEWDKEDVVNMEEFEIKIKAYNLENRDYDIKVYITKENDEIIISETYNDEEDKWQSSRYYLNDFFTSSGNKSNHISLRIDEDYSDFKGDGKIIARIRESGKTDYIDEIEKDIEILEKENKEIVEEKTEESTEKQETTITPTAIATGDVIRLGKRESDSIDVTGAENNKEDIVLYESSSEKAKKYAIYAFAFLLLILVVILVKKKL